MDEPIDRHPASVEPLRPAGRVSDDPRRVRRAGGNEQTLVAEVVDLQSRIQRVRAARIDKGAVRWDDLGELLRHRRVELDLSQETVAEAVDCTGAAVAGVEAASMRLTVDGFVAFCHALHLDPSLVLRHAVD